MPSGAVALWPLVVAQLGEQFEVLVGGRAWLGRAASHDQAAASGDFHGIEG